MVLGFGETKSARPTRPDDVAALIAKKDYARAIQLIKKQLETNRHDTRLRLQLGDLLFLAGKTKEAVAILSARPETPSDTLAAAVATSRPIVNATVTSACAIRNCSR